ncbi:unnamed protein product, partial [Oppiella nova]
QPVISAQELEFPSETETKAEEEEEAAHLAAAEASEEAPLEPEEVVAPGGAVFEEEADPEEADKIRKKCRRLKNWTQNSMPILIRCELCHPLIHVLTLKTC